MPRKNEPLTESYFYILLCLYHTPMHGYGIMQKTAELSQGNVKIDSGRDILEQEIRRLKHLVEISEKIIKEGK